LVDFDLPETVPALAKPEPGCFKKNSTSSAF
jgi:hypothetical protein